MSRRKKFCGRGINVDKKLRNSFGDYVQTHSNTIDNSMNDRMSGAFGLMPSGNLVGSRYNLLLINYDIVKRNKATPMLMTDDIIEFVNKKALSKPIFERGIHHEVIDDIDHDDQIVINEFIPVIVDINQLHDNISSDEDGYV